MEENLNLFKRIFRFNNEIKLTTDEKEYLIELQKELKKYIAEHGEEGKTKIKEIILDTLLDDKQHNIIKFLNLQFDNQMTTKYEEKITSKDFLSQENKENTKDFFKSYLIDDTLNDLYMTWKGYTKTNEGAKEKFVKVRKAVIPNNDIDALYQLLLDNFNKINFVSDKKDEEQAELIKLTLEQSLLILLHIEYECCNTQKTIQIMSAIALKMTNLIGYSEKHREQMFSAMSDSFQSSENYGAKPRNNNLDNY
jgi:hypothetical protein